MINRLFASIGLASTALFAASAGAAPPLQPKVMLITMFAPEAQNWIERLQLKDEIRIPGLSAEYPTIRCNAERVTTQQEDNSTYEALLRASREGRVDINRLAVLRAGSDFDRPEPGGNEVDNLLKYADQGAFVPALENLFRTGNPLVQDIVKNWSAWENGVPGL